MHRNTNNVTKVNNWQNCALSYPDIKEE